MYSVLKKDLTEIIINNLSPIRNEYNKIISDKTYLNDLLKKGSDNASYRARKTLIKYIEK